MESAPRHSRPPAWLWRFAGFTAAATLGLIGMGGLVTSHGVGMAVPDWPTTYGYNMFLFPPSQWVGGIFYEHTHRLAASAVGLLTLILTACLWLLPRCAAGKGAAKTLGLVALGGVILQGVMGGLRVTLYKDEIGIVHATLAQFFLVLISIIAWYLSPRWDRVPCQKVRIGWSAMRVWLLLATILVVLQLIIGAAMRHQHAGLAVPDFPLAYGKIWPATDAATLAGINQARIDVRDYNPITAFQIWLHMVHRLNALAVFSIALLMVWKARRQFGAESGVARFAVWWFAAIIAQAFLGAMTVWSNKAADVATLHVVLGSGILVLSSIMAMIGYRASRMVPATAVEAA